MIVCWGWQTNYGRRKGSAAVIEEYPCSWLTEEKDAERKSFGTVAFQNIAAYKIAHQSALHKLLTECHCTKWQRMQRIYQSDHLSNTCGNKCLVIPLTGTFSSVARNCCQRQMLWWSLASKTWTEKGQRPCGDDMLTTTVMACRCQKFFHRPWILPWPWLENSGCRPTGCDPATTASSCMWDGAGKMPVMNGNLWRTQAAFQKTLASKLPAGRTHPGGHDLVHAASPTIHPEDGIRQLQNGHASEERRSLKRTYCHWACLPLGCSTPVTSWYVQRAVTWLSGWTGYHHRLPLAGR